MVLVIKNFHCLSFSMFSYSFLDKLTHVFEILFSSDILMGYIIRVLLSLWPIGHKLNIFIKFFKFGHKLNIDFVEYYTY